MDGVLALMLTELLQFQLRGTLGNTDVRPVVPLPARSTLHPDILSLALLLSHDAYSTSEPGLKSVNYRSVFSPGRLS
jgi:hypothetical protein